MPASRSTATHSTYAVIAALCAIGGVIALYADPASPKEMALALLPLLSTLAGATLAFRLNEYTEARRQRSAERQALIRALFVLLRQDNAVRQVKSLLDTAPTIFEKAFLLHPVKPPTYSDLKQSFADLEFLLRTDQSQLLLELTVEQERFEQAMESLQVRNRFYVEDVQPMLHRHQMIERKIPAAEFEDRLGKWVFSGAMLGAENMTEHVAASSLSIPEMHGKLLVVARGLFKGDKFVTYDKT